MCQLHGFRRGRRAARRRQHGHVLRGVDLDPPLEGLGLQGEHWWRGSLLIPYGESMANGLRTLVGEERVRRSASEQHVRL